MNEACFYSFGLSLQIWMLICVLLNLNGYLGHLWLEIKKARRGMHLKWISEVRINKLSPNQSKYHICLTFSSVILTVRVSKHHGWAFSQVLCCLSAWMSFHPYTSPLQNVINPIFTAPCMHEFFVKWPKIITRDVCEISYSMW